MDAIRIPITLESDIVTARIKGREAARRAGFKGSDLTLVSVVISEMARCIKSSVPEGELIVTICNDPGKVGIVITARSCLEKVFQDLLNNDGLQQSMDEFRVRFEQRETILTMKRWQNVWI